jgi:hypothetical protein
LELRLRLKSYRPERLPKTLSLVETTVGDWIRLYNSQLKYHLKQMDTLSQSLSPDQLLAYIKKQKARIKQLEKENEGFRKEKENFIVQSHALVQSEKVYEFDPLLFWPMIEREPQFVQNIARSSINSLVSSIGHNGLCRPSACSNSYAKRSYFLTWKMATVQLRGSEAVGAEASLRSELQAAEVKIAKLKTLLSRTHQANQRNLEG